MLYLKNHAVSPGFPTSFHIFPPEKRPKTRPQSQASSCQAHLRRPALLGVALGGAVLRQHLAGRAERLLRSFSKSIIKKSQKKMSQKKTKNIIKHQIFLKNNIIQHFQSSIDPPAATAAATVSRAASDRRAPRAARAAVPRAAPEAAARWGRRGRLTWQAESTWKVEIIPGAHLDVFVVGFYVVLSPKCSKDRARLRHINGPST